MPAYSPQVQESILHYIGRKSIMKQTQERVKHALQYRMAKTKGKWMNGTAHQEVIFDMLINAVNKHNSKSQLHRINNLTSIRERMPSRSK